MSSYISENKNELQNNHYIRQATSNNYWVDFSKGKLDKYIERKGADFCLIINGSTELNNDYILPYKAISHLLTEEYFSPNRPRWVFTINNNILHIPGKDVSISVTAYYNAFQLLDDKEINNVAIENDVIFPTEIERWDIDVISDLIKSYNKKYSNASPEKKVTISETISRPGPISDYLKKINNYVCQICNTEGFVQKNNTRYAEAHHIIELHKLSSGSYCSDNIIVVCPTCHKKLHYADIVCTEVNNQEIRISINNKVVSVKKNIIS